MKASDIKDTPREMTRRERYLIFIANWNMLLLPIYYLLIYIYWWFTREAAEKAASQQRYWKLHQEGKTEQAKADLERLAIIKKQREEAALRRKAEQEGIINWFLLHYLAFLAFLHK